MIPDYAAQIDSERAELTDLAEAVLAFALVLRLRSAMDACLQVRNEAQAASDADLRRWGLLWHARLTQLGMILPMRGAA
jgi:hypothetical protein